MFKNRMDEGLMEIRGGGKPKTKMGRGSGDPGWISTDPTPYNNRTHRFGQMRILAVTLCSSSFAFEKYTTEKDSKLHGRKTTSLSQFKNLSLSIQIKPISQLRKS